MNKYKEYAKNIYTQNGDDGIIEKLFEELDIKNGVCVEFGAWDGIFISNIYNLWKNKGFNGILIESDRDKFLELHENTKNFKNVEIFNTFISYKVDSEDCLDNVLSKSRFNLNDDNYALLSIDIDSADYYIFKSIEKHRPKIIICETNTDYKINQPHASLHGGCSLYSLNELAKQKNYELIFHNGNGYFVRQDIYEKIKFDKTLEELFCDTPVVQGFYQKLNKEGKKINEIYWLSEEYKKIYKLEQEFCLNYRGDK